LVAVWTPALFQINGLRFTKKKVSNSQINRLGSINKCKEFHKRFIKFKYKYKEQIKKKIFTIVFYVTNTTLPAFICVFFV